MQINQYVKGKLYETVITPVFLSKLQELSKE